MPIRQVQVDVDDGTLDLWDESVITVRVRLQNRDLTTVFAKRLPGPEALYVSVIAEAVFGAWPLAATLGDIRTAAQRAYIAVKRQAKMHEQA